MTNAPKPLTASAIKYLLILLELCKNETARGAWTSQGSCT